MVTIRDIAKATGVSASTVSRALADSDLIPIETKSKITKAAYKLGYIPNAAAKSLKTKRANNIGIISFVEEVLGFSHYLFARILDSFIKVVSDSNYDITLISDKFLSDDSDLVGHCLSRNLDGVLIFCADTNVKQIQILLKSKIPVVVIDNFSEDIIASTHCITSDNRKKMFDLTEYIVSQGHRDIVYVCGQDIFVTNERLKGFYSALEANGISTKDRIVPSRYYNIDDASEKINAILDKKPLPTCIIVPDDYVALKAYDIIKSRGLSVGGDISVAGFDGLEISRQIYPRLATVIQDTGSIGRLAAHTILKSINCEKPPFLQIVPASLFKGESIAALKT